MKELDARHLIFEVFDLPETPEILQKIFRGQCIPFKHNGAWYGLHGHGDVKAALEFIGERAATIDDD